MVAVVNETFARHGMARASGDGAAVHAADEGQRGAVEWSAW
jgi:hypothetical protein